MSKKEMLAHPNIRYISTAIDGLIIMILLLPLMFLSRLVDSELLLFNIITFLYSTVVYTLVDVVVPICTKGQTIGRYLFNIRLVRDDFTFANYKNFLLRASIFIVIAFVSNVIGLVTVGYILWAVVFAFSIYWLYNDEHRQTVHDRIAKTVVVYEKLFSEGT